MHRSSTASLTRAVFCLDDVLGPLNRMKRYAQCGHIGDHGFFDWVLATHETSKVEEQNQLP